MDLYIVLGLERSASTPEIKRAYRRLARRFHPDINPGDSEALVRFRQISEAYETLVDPDRRRRYDLGQTHARPGDTTSTYGFAGFDFSGGSVHGDRATTFGDLFEEVFTRHAGRRPTTPERGADLHARVSISFEEAWRGVECPITVTRHVRCRACTGSGHHRVAEARCVSCEGTGTVRSVRGHMVFSKNCVHCAGSGRLRERVCPACHGQSVETRTDTLGVRVPPGVADGARVRVAGRGHAGRRGGDAGDLYVDVHVRPHRLFRREGDDVHMTVPIGIDEAVLGARIEIPTPDGAARLRIVPGTQSGQRLRLRGRGAVSLRDGSRGDLIVDVRLMLPRVLDERSKALIREFGQINGGENVRADLLRGD
jgi:molecular chaperone DnaJ